MRQRTTRAGADGADCGVNIVHWLESLLPHLPHYGFVLVFAIVFLNNIGLPLPGETVLLGAGFVLGRVSGMLTEPMLEALLAGAVASFLGGICAFATGRRIDQDKLSKVHWLHLTPKRLDWAERFFRRHGAKTVFISRFIALFPPVAVNLLAGMTQMTWQNFLVFNLTGSVAFSCFYLALGHLAGNKWTLVVAWFSHVVG